MKTLNASAFGYAGAVISVACMLLLGILGILGLYTGAVAMMKGWHMFFSLSVAGIVGGMVEAAIIGFVIFYLFALVYNMFVTKNKN
ncbi:MAG: hypothetical protein UY39_C0033G0002 [Candidatus Kaiserbacteria bacterium GW2011_GWC2_49_12]|uniref:Uncharacterized protein n=3 Tax=Candidatus Kaiseribacteriota TaxID=1752734 RepID=A0A0G1ZFC4_9BACT|nr:MAG: hypothetical protein UY39_C0033G0002 [Candidatus Kaiserbacteria bacterium GW2011_GWC2_49_12]KKW17954.1 MAG: hypothetical protein UY57_C0005G0004 [Candidatus Kaiserbacteria bacterium GW2011_GWB1_50_17]KKW18655.1 MAG: hypothetical protein UY59_C0001G0026 [Candidatus Kaiserbacteria bacterium GW2011_GWA1_50_28]